MPTPAAVIEDELERIAVELRNPTEPDRYTQLYAAQQALSWASFPEQFMPPHEAIMAGKVMPLFTDTPEDSADCSAALRQVPS